MPKIVFVNDEYLSAGNRVGGAVPPVVQRKDATHLPNSSWPQKLN